MNPCELDATYVRRIRKYPILSLEEEYKLAKEYREKGNKQAIDKLLNSHLRLVTKIATGYRGYGLPLSDLVAEGNLGMMQAIKHYDPEKGYRFSTYAIWWIKAGIQEYILKTWSLVKLGTTSSQKKLFFNLRKAKQLDSHDLSPELAEKIAKKLGTKVEEVYQMNHRLTFQDHSLNNLVKESDGGIEWVEWLADDRDNQEVHIVQQDEMAKRRRLLEKAMKGLNKRERDTIIARRLTEPPLTLEEISHQQGISRERVRQVETKAFEKLQKHIKFHSTLTLKDI